ncbi:AraC-type DNA-binding protein [Aristaeella hokkaidonensis]|uniref:Helix-turn-helix transcriptional regulator n=1 Tax=Aristaeella hokkaidonensis TaxID=3046382 RepID=A0AC61MW22_9FIRM|nr:helix-turn-helix transcriptional regulator [Aristaeella hokkaidonensis]SNT94511.1 AraC-type DNA-binding protein [Aristaeella hokkaidonensis]
MSQMRSAEVSARAARYEDGFRVLQGRREYVTYLDDSSIRIWYSDIPWRYETHDHSAVEILLTLEGMVTYTIEDKIYQVRKGEILIVPPDTLHSLTMGEGSSRYLFLFESDAIMTMRDIKSMAMYFHKPFHLRDGSDAHVRIRELLLRAREAYEKREMMWNTMCYSCILRVYATLGQRYLSGIKPRTGDNMRNMDSEVINAVMTYINNHYREELSLEDVAKFAGFSRYYFSRSFKRQTGYSFKDYLCQKRLQVAMDLLIRTNRSMRDVAIESGFGSVATFNRVFREKKGCTPTQYRAIYGTY